MLRHFVMGEISKRVLDVASAIDDALICDELQQIAKDIDEATRELLLAALGDGVALILPPRDEEGIK